jgi:GT2 family glycosyltransferase
MPDNPLVYIIVLNYNRKDDTLDCIRSLYAMDYPNFRVMLVDNASTDGSVDAVRAAFPQVETLVNRRNLMYAGGNNAGIRRALEQGAEFVMLINNDTFVDTRLLSELMDGFAKVEGAGLAGPMIYYDRPGQPGPDIIWYAGGIVQLSRGLIAHRDIRRPDSGRYSGVEETGYVTGCCMLISQECLERVGMLDTTYRMYSEDADYSMRAHLAGFRLLFVPRARMWHKVSLSTGGEFSPKKMRLKLGSNLRFFFRYARPWQYLTAPFFALGRVILFVLTRGR